jgi:JmjC domain-containing hydroxylase/monoamine-oxidase A repressor R1-like protein
MPLTISHYFNHIGKLTDQFFENKDNYKDKNRQRMYLKDIDCPPVWQDKLTEYIPTGLFYWNDSTGEIGGPGSVNEPTFHGASRRKGKGIAPAGDLMSSLPQEMRAENLMCYIGHEGTYTPAHREMCASLGQNIMVYTSQNVDENGTPQKPGSSIWFMTETKDRHTVSEYWLSVLGHDIEIEEHFAQISAWQRAPFKVYVVEQKIGDFILIPPLAPHQVWNRGTCTMKVAWNRTTVKTLSLAVHEALPKARMVCRDEQYKNKAMVYYTLMKYSGLLKKAHQLANRSQQEEYTIMNAKKIRQLQKDFKILFDLFKEILLSEMFTPQTKEQCEYMQFDSNVICSYCRGNIFNRFLTCKSCVGQFGGEDPYDICMDCFVMGRSCRCQSKYKWVEQFKWKDLCDRYEDWRRQYIELDQGMTGITPCTLTDERRLYPKKTVAQICQEQLRIRPWVDINVEEPPEEEDDDEEPMPQFNGDGSVKKIVKKRSQFYLNKNKSCHFCLKRHPKWTMAECKCGKSYCYGSLFRAHDLLPQAIMEDPNWECPHCRYVCSTGACRKDPKQNPYQPKGTMLGYDTSKVADLRSVEVLVDFRISNQSWLKEHGDTPLERRLVEAEQVKSNGDAIDGFTDIDDDDGYGQRIEYSPIQDTIDPALGGGVPDNVPDQLNRPEQDTEHTRDREDSQELFVSHAPVYPELNEAGAPQDYIHPSTVLHEPSHDTEMSFTAVNSSPKKSKKRRLDDIEPIKLIHPKKRKQVLEDSTPVKNKASKQYQQEQDKRLLDQARKEGKYLITWGRINKRSIVVQLSLEPEILCSFKEREIANREKRSRTAMEANILLRSDIVPLDVPASQQAQTALSKPKSYKARIEDDDDFRSRRKKALKPRFEEIYVDDEDEDGEVLNNPSCQIANAQRRRSMWQSQKHQDDPELPDELPADWKDGYASRPRNRNRKSDPGQRRSIAQKAPKTCPIGSSAGQIDQAELTQEEEDDEFEDAVSQNNDGESAEAGQDEPSVENHEDNDKTVELAQLALIEEENRLAKLQAARWANGDDDSEEDDPPAKAVTPQKADLKKAKGGQASLKSSAMVSSTSKGSIMNKMKGKKVKIISSALSGSRKLRGPPGLAKLPEH